MSEIINLRQAKKQKARAGRQQQADANRVKFGKNKTEILLAKRTIARDEKHLDGHKLSTRNSDRPNNDSD